MTPPTLSELCKKVMELDTDLEVFNNGTGTLDGSDVRCALVMSGILSLAPQIAKRALAEVNAYKRVVRALCGDNEAKQCAEEALERYLREELAALEGGGDE